MRERVAVSAGIVKQFQQAMSQERFAQARSLAEQALSASPDDAVAHDMVRSALVGLSMYEAALNSARRVTELLPTHAGGWSSYGAILGVLEREGAAAAFTRAVELEPEQVTFRLELITALLNERKLAEAERECRLAMEKWPGETGLVFRLAAALSEQGKPGEAAAELGAALFKDPANLHLAMTMCANSNYAWCEDQSANIARHKNFGRLVMLADPRTPMKHVKPKAGGATPTGLKAPGRGKDGRLRVGFLSSDFRAHSVAWFIEPVLMHLDRSKFEVLAYSSDPREDAVTRRLQRAVALGPMAEGEEGGAVASAGGAGNAVKGWRRVAMMDGYRAAKLMVDDRVDVLVELNGLTAGARWDLLRLKPAPIQITYCGYPNTTGIPSVDYRVVDSATDPLEDGDPAQKACVEKLIRLDPCFLCYRPASAAVMGPSRGECGRGVDAGAVVFGSFNNLTKVSEVCLSAWGRVLRQVAGSTLVIKSPALADESVRALSVQRLAAAGIDPSRVRLMGGEKSTAEHLGRYREIDIALDTFPYAGTTTTCEALVMGVPVVCMCRAMVKGGSHAERVGASLLRCVGLEDLAAESVEGFVQNAAGLARDTRRLEELHRTLRGRLMGSALCDGPGHAQRFGDAVAQAWNAWAGS